MVRLHDQMEFIVGMEYWCYTYFGLAVPLIFLSVQLILLTSYIHTCVDSGKYMNVSACQRRCRFVACPDPVLHCLRDSSSAQGNNDKKQDGYWTFQILMLKINHLLKNQASMNYRMLAAIQLLSNQPNNWEPKYLRQGVKNN